MNATTLVKSKKLDRITIPFETLRSMLPQTFDLLPNPVEFRAVVNGKLVAKRKDWVGIGWCGDDEATGTEPILVIDEDTVHAELRAVRAKISPIPAGNYNRLWLRCPRCGRYQYRDYVPFSMSNPILTTACGHGFYKDLHEVATLQQRVGVTRIKTEWHDLMDVLDVEARKYIDSLKAKPKKR